MACSTTPLSQAQLQQLALAAGFPSALAPVMAAIAMAESGGCPTAVNPTDNGGRQTSWGLWQISDGTHNILSMWNDPATNAHYAFQKYQTQGLAAWGTYTSGAYKQYLSGAPPGSAASQIPGTSASTPTQSSGGISGLIDWFNTNLKQPIAWLSNPVRPVKLVAGILMILLALVLLVAPEAEKIAEKAGPFLAAA